MQSTSGPYARELQLARSAVLRAAILTKKVLASVSHISKSDASPVTTADFAAQSLLISALHSVFPNDRFVGEEDAEVLRTDESLREQVWRLVCETTDDDDNAAAAAGLAKPKDIQAMMDMIDLGGKGTGGHEGRFWVMDPIDGTATFLKGQQYAVALALVQDGKQVLGVLAFPNLCRTEDGRIEEHTVDEEGMGLMLSAVEGQGAYQCAVNARGEIRSEDWVALPRLRAPPETKDWHIVDSVASSSTDHDKMRELARRLGTAYPGTDCWSSHVRYAAMILGGGDLLARIPISPTKRSLIWDHAGAQLIFTEVGGKVTDLDGEAMDFGAGRDFNRNRGILAAKSDIHDRVRELVDVIAKR